MKKQTEPEKSFEESFDALEKIVAQLEEGELPLSKLVEEYERGMALLKACQERLSEAEAKIEAIRETPEGLKSEALEVESSS